MQKENGMKQKTSVDIALEYLKKAQQEIYEQNPPPYSFPSDDGRVAQMLADSINMIEIIKKKSLTN